MTEILAGEQCGEIRSDHRPAEQVALHFIAPRLAQEVELLGGLDAFGHHAQVQLVAERDDRLHDHGVVGIGGQIDDERTVDLELVDRKALQVAEARIAGAEIIDRDLHAERLDAAEHLDVLLGAVHGQAFGQFDLQKMRVQASDAQCLGDRIDDIALAELAWRDVD